MWSFTRENNQRGQSILEFSLSIGIALFLLIGTGHLILHHWKRIQCSHDLFEFTRKKLNQMGDSSLKAPFSLETKLDGKLRRTFWIERTENYLVGKAHCKNVQEEIRFQVLDQ